MKNNKTEINLTEKLAKLLTFNPNLILTGPSGTGKTYLSRKIIENIEQKKSDYETLEKQGRVKFITFHPSYTYEQFIEGIKPVFQSSPEKIGKQTTGYKIENGVLKNLAISAYLDILKTQINPRIRNLVTNTSKIWKVSLGYRKTEERIYKTSKKEKEIVIGWLENESLEGKSYNEIYGMLQSRRGNDEPKLSSDADSINSLVNEIKKGDFVMVYDTPSTITDIGIVTGAYFHDYSTPYPHKRKVAWFKEFKTPVDISGYDNQTRFTLKTIYELENISFADLREIIKADNNFELNSKVPLYYLIIDEINRGNILQIFGETISLLEKDKRDKYKATLLYSGKKFSLPPNLFIIGTMNPLVHSDFLSDPVFQRRFLFVRTETDLKLLKQSGKINLAEMLEKLNKRIVNKLGNNHIIGHGYFMGCKSIDDIYNTWYYSIIPLLTAYFGNDIEEVISLIGSRYFDKSGNLFYLDESSFVEAVLKL